MANEQQLREALKNLLTAIQETPATDEAQAEQQNARISLAVLRADSLVSSWDAQQPATPEPVAWMASYGDPIGNDHVYVTSHHDLAVENDMHGEPKPLYTHPAPSVPVDVVRDEERYRFILAAADDMTASRYKSLCELLGVAITEDFDLGAAIDAAMLAAK